MTSARSSYAELASKRHNSYPFSKYKPRPQSANPYESIHNVSKREQELTEHLKLQSKKYKTKYEIMLKEKNISDERYSKMLMECEEWKSKYKSTDLNLNHLNTKFKNATTEIKMSHQRELSRIQLVSENKVQELQTKYDQEQMYVKQLKNLNSELSINFENLQNKYNDAKTYQSSLENKLETSMKRALEVQESLSQQLCIVQKDSNQNDNKYNDAKTYQSSLENKLETSMKRALEVQESLSQQLCIVQKDSNQNDNKYTNDMERLNNLLSIKESDVKFLRSQLNKERDEYHHKLNDKNKTHLQHVQKLQNEMNSFSKEVQSLERQREEFARNSQIAADSLRKALAEYSSERESLSRLHCAETERKDKQIDKYKQTVSRQQERLHKLLDLKKQNEIGNSKLKQHIRNLKHDLSRNNGDVLRLTQELKHSNENKSTFQNKHNKMDKLYSNLQSKYDNLISDLSIITTQRDEYKKHLNERQHTINEKEMEKNQLIMKSETAMEMNDALKLELENIRRQNMNRVAVSKYNEASEKCNTLSFELSECYKKIEHLSLALDSTKCDLNKVSRETIPMKAYEHLAKNLNKLERENMSLNKKMNQMDKENTNLNDEVNDNNVRLNSYRQERYSFKKSIDELTHTNRQIKDERVNLKNKYRKIKNKLEDLSKVTRINQDLVRSNRFLRNELASLINQDPMRLSRECANGKCNKSKGTYLKIHPNTLVALKKACNL
eukprot:485547_1